MYIFLNITLLILKFLQQLPPFCVPNIKTKIAFKKLYSNIAELDLKKQTKSLKYLKFAVHKFNRSLVLTNLASFWKFFARAHTFFTYNNGVGGVAV